MSDKVFIENRLREYEECGYPHLRNQVVAAIALVSREGPGSIGLDQLKEVWERAEEEFLSSMQASVVKKKNRRSNNNNNNNGVGVGVGKQKTRRKIIRDEDNRINDDLVWEDEEFSLSEMKVMLVDMFLDRVILACFALFSNGGVEVEFEKKQNKDVYSVVHLGTGIAEANARMEKKSKHEHLEYLKLNPIPIQVTQSVTDVDLEALKMAQERSNEFALASISSKPTSISTHKLGATASLKYVKKRQNTNGVRKRGLVIDDGILLKAFDYSKMHCPVFCKIPVTKGISLRLMKLQMGFH